MSLRLPRLTTRSVARTTRLFFTPTANQTSLRPLLNSNTPLRSFAFYRRSIRGEDVPVVPAYRILRLPVDSIKREQTQDLWMQLRDGLGEDEYKDVAARVESHVTDAVAAAYASNRAYRQQFFSTADTASGSAASRTISAVSIDLIYKSPLPKFPRLTAAINIRVVLNDEDVPRLLIELRHADDRIKSVFLQPEIFDA